MDALVNFLQSHPIPVVLGFIAVLITIGTPIYRWTADENRTPPSQPVAYSRSVVETMECRYCGGAGSVIARNDGVQIAHATCGICSGDGVIVGPIVTQPDCRRCNGSGRLLSENVEVVRRKRRIHRQHNSLVYPCDVCSGVGKRPVPVDGTTS